MFFKTGGNIFRNGPPTVWAWTVLNADLRSKQVIAKVTATLRFSILITLGYLAWLGLRSFYTGHLIIRFYTNQENLNSNTGSWRYKKTAWLNSKIKYTKELKLNLNKLSKGQTISEWIYEVIVSQKLRTKIAKISALATQGRNPDNFLFVFWEKRWIQKFILKMSDL